MGHADRRILSSQMNIEHTSSESRTTDSLQNQRIYSSTLLSAFNNEFLSKAGEDWLKRLRAGEFTQKGQKLKKREILQKKRSIDPWKVKNFEPIWGRRNERSTEIMEKNISPSTDTIYAENLPETCANEIKLENSSVDTNTYRRNDQVELQFVMESTTDAEIQLPSERVPLHCLCHKPYINGHKLVGCDFCEKWACFKCNAMQSDDITSFAEEAIKELIQ